MCKPSARPISRRKLFEPTSTAASSIRLGRKDHVRPSPPAPLPKGEGRRRETLLFTWDPLPQPLSLKGEGRHRETLLFPLPRPLSLKGEGRHTSRLRSDRSSSSRPELRRSRRRRTAGDPAAARRCPEKGSVSAARGVRAPTQRSRPLWRSHQAW